MLAHSPPQPNRLALYFRLAFFLSGNFIASFWQVICHIILNGRAT
jgi:hypothetical protein